MAVRLVLACLYNSRSYKRVAPSSDNISSVSSVKPETKSLVVKLTTDKRPQCVVVVTTDRSPQYIVEETTDKSPQCVVEGTTDKSPQCVVKVATDKSPQRVAKVMKGGIRANPADH